MRIDNPLSQDQLKQGDIIQPGNYQFEVLDAIEKVSKSGKEMIELKLLLWMPDGRERTLFDYLLASMEWKIGHFAEATGLYQKYFNDKVINAHDCIGKCGELKTYIQKDKSGQYADKAAVADYLPTADAATAKAERKAESAKPKDEFDSDVPF